MTTQAAIVLLMFALDSGIVWQARPDLSGTWTYTDSVIEGRGNLPAGQLLLGQEPIKLVTSEAGGRLRIEEHRSALVTLNTMEYGLNGQSIKTPFVVATNAAFLATPAEITSKWQENKLVSTIDVLVPGESDPRHYTETMSISPEGILAVRIQRVGSSDSRTVFYRKSR